MTDQMSGIARVAELTRAFVNTLDSGKIRTGAAFLLGAVAFALANLLLAKHLTPSAYGVLALVVAIVAAGTPVAPFGLATIVVRRNLALEPKLLLRCAGTSTLVALAAAALSAVVYDLAAALLFIIVAAVIGGGFTRLASAKYQAEQRFLVSTLVSESTNYMLLIAAAGVLVADIDDPIWPLAFVCVCQLLLASVLSIRLATVPTDVTTPSAKFRVSEMLLLTGTSAATMVMVQIERFAIPVFLDIQALAQFAVLAVCTIAPFRLVEVSVYRTLLPRLSHLSSAVEYRRLLSREARHALIVFVGLGVPIAVFTPPIVDLLFSGKYEFSFGTVLAGIFLGQLRVVHSIVSATIAALADQRSLLLWNLAAWLSVLTSFLGGWMGSPWGLQGFLWGVAVGGITGILFTLPLVFSVSANKAV